MIAKTLTGVQPIDEKYGGIFRGRSTMVYGRSESGKTLFGMQFLQQGLRQGERCLMLSANLADDMIIYAESFGLPFSAAVNSGALIMLEYQNYIPGRDSEENMTLPPEGFLQFKQIVDSNVVQRVLLDTVLPWVAIRPQDKLAEHVFSFIRAFDRMGVTTLMTMPRPVSPMASRLKNALEEVVPVSIMLHYDAATRGRTMQVTKYLGEKKMSPEIPFKLKSGHGFVSPDFQERAAAPAATSEQQPAVTVPAASSFRKAMETQPPAQTRPATAQSGRIRFADALPKP